MELPDIITRLPEVALPFPPEGMRAYLLQSQEGQVVFFEIYADAYIPPHSHGGQWGTVLDGKVELTIGDETRCYLPGDSYVIPSGTIHSAKLVAGTKFLDYFEECDRHKRK
ncbi:cupin domain-containing protein [Ferribacterium limneticum]|uniref:cupin domain-containing protein n=1 Tax=Ferribacterium limneticum TaxID=76259 RepID=UPI001CF871FE|nr:cupin domain-containing protein [Ferribacterium limneticum]UCV24390.1 cupin domain-containing protein [Ferribacterium limneticum]